jgi:hypothetical protein
MTLLRGHGLTGLFVAFLGITCAGRAGAAESIFVGNNGVPPFTIGEYTIAGVTVNASLVSGLGGPQGIAISGGDLFVTNGFGNRSRRGGGWNWVGVVSGLFNPNDSGVRALERRPRHDEGYHEGGGCGRRSFAFG